MTKLVHPNISQDFPKNPPMALWAPYMSYVKIYPSLILHLGFQGRVWCSVSHEGGVPWPIAVFHVTTVGKLHHSISIKKAMTHAISHILFWILGRLNQIQEVQHALSDDLMKAAFIAAIALEFFWLEDGCHWDASPRAKKGRWFGSQVYQITVIAMEEFVGPYWTSDWWVFGVWR